MTIHHPNTNPDQKNPSEQRLSAEAEQASRVSTEPSPGHTPGRVHKINHGFPESGLQASAPHSIVPADRGHARTNPAERCGDEAKNLSATSGIAHTSPLEDLRLALGAGNGEKQASGQDSAFFFPAFDDPATAVALAVRFARKAKWHSIPLAPPVLSLLDFHADQGDASCQAVRAWLARTGLVRTGTCGSRPATGARDKPEKEAAGPREWKVSV